MTFFSKAAYSKEKETEADKNGLDIFLKTGYSADAAISVFNVLHYSYLPFSSIEFDRSFVEIGPFKWLNNQFIGETTPVFAEEDKDDTLSTHPNTFKRKELIKSIISGNEGKEYLISKEEFQLIQKICRYEYCREALLNRDYTGAIYSAFALLKEDTGSLYLKKVIAKSLYSISTYYNQGYRDELRMRYHLEQGPSQRATYFFKELYAYEANAFAAYYLFTLCSQYPEDKELKPLLDETLYWLAYLHYPIIQKTNPNKIEVIDTTQYTAVLDTIQNAADIINIDAMRLLNTNNSFNAMLDMEGFIGLYKVAYEKTVTDKAAVAPLFSDELDSTESSIELTKGERNRNHLNEYKNYRLAINHLEYKDYKKNKAAILWNF
ncbi:M48 family metalloprotease [Oscillatoria amoena NRMC-F 0135]|nr:M48 family metalloprotease [Oscillatoria amoena NRMC-F 0135]